MPRCGRSQKRSSDQKPSIVLTCTSQKPSPSSSGVFAAPVADRFVLIPPGRQAGVDAILVGMDERAFGNRGRDDRLDRRLLHVGQHVQDYLASALDQAEDGWLVLLQRAPARRAGQPATAPEPPLLATAAGWPLWPATT